MKYEGREWDHGFLCNILEMFLFHFNFSFSFMKSNFETICLQQFIGMATTQEFILFKYVFVPFFVFPFWNFAYIVASLKNEINVDCLKSENICSNISVQAKFDVFEHHPNYVLTAQESGAFQHFPEYRCQPQSHTWNIIYWIK